jgi:hypothetical protein
VNYFLAAFHIINSKAFLSNPELRRRKGGEKKKMSRRKGRKKKKEIEAKSQEK